MSYSTLTFTENFTFDADKNYFEISLQKKEYVSNFIIQFGKLSKEFRFLVAFSDDNFVTSKYIWSNSSHSRLSLSVGTGSASAANTNYISYDASSTEMNRCEILYKNVTNEEGVATSSPKRFMATQFRIYPAASSVGTTFEVAEIKPVIVSLSNDYQGDTMELSQNLTIRTNNTGSDVLQIDASGLSAWSGPDSEQNYTKITALGLESYATLSDGTATASIKIGKLAEGVYGAWFPQVSIGGTSFDNAPIMTDDSGNITVTTTNSTVDGGLFTMKNGTGEVSFQCTLNEDNFKINGGFDVSGTFTASSTANFQGAITASSSLTMTAGAANQLIMSDYRTTQSHARFGSLEIQGYAINNCWLADNIYYVSGGNGWTYRNNGYGNLFYMDNGYFHFDTFPSGLAGTSATKTERMRITNAGLVGIGTTTPTTNLEISAVSPTLQLSDQRAVATTNDVIGTLSFYSNDGDGAHVAGKIQCICDTAEIWGRNNALTFGIHPLGTGADTTEAMRISSVGYVGIGTTSPIAPLDVQGAARTGTHSAGLAAACITGNLGTYDGIRFTHTNGTQGIAFGYQGIRKFGSDAFTGSSYLTIDAEATGALLLQTISTGNVGIGTVVPHTKLFIAGDFDGAAGLPTTNENKGLTICKSTGGAGDYGIGDTFGLTFSTQSNNTNSYPCAGIFAKPIDVASYTSGELHFATHLMSEANLITRMLITNAGNVSIGTSTGTLAKLNVVDGGMAQTVVCRISADDAIPYGLVVANNTAGLGAAAGLRMYVHNDGVSVLDSYTSGSAATLYINNNAGRVGIGAADVHASASLTVNPAATYTYGVYSSGTVGGGVAVLGINPSGHGVMGKSSSTGYYGAYGYNAAGHGTFGYTAATGYSGVRGSSSGASHGVSGYASNTSYYAVYAVSGAGIGIYAQGTGPNYYGVYGYNGSGYAIMGYTGGSGYAGVRGSSSGNSHGVYGYASNSDYYGVYGKNLVGGGVYGYSSSSNHAGVHGVNAKWAGVYGESLESSGVYGAAAGTGWAIKGYAVTSTAYSGYFSGGNFYIGLAASTTGALVISGVPATSSALGIQQLIINTTTGDVFRYTSSIRYKQNVRTFEIDARYWSLRPVYYDSLGKVNDNNIGLIAEEVNLLYPVLVSKDSESKPDGVMYSQFGVLAVAATQLLKKVTDAQANTLTQHEQEIQEIKAKHESEIADLRSELEALKALIIQGAAV